MPELPEVESLRQSLIPFVRGQRIRSIQVTKPKLVSDKGTKRVEDIAKVQEFINSLTGEKIVGVDRKAKNLIFNFESSKVMMVHLKMTGQLVYQSHDKKNMALGGHPIQESEVKLPNKHSHVIFELEDGTLFYNDTRMFGYLLYYPNFEILETSNHFDELGLDPADPNFTAEYFIKNLAKTSSSIKRVFLSQKIVIGLGNIYADEACFQAKIRPTRSAKSLTKKEVEALWQAIVTIIPRAIQAGGSSVANYLLADGSRGNYARSHQVYGRGGLPCLICGRKLTKIEEAGRTTVYCEHCQK
jgi:formamidopyrimidine-DNA glycosylase